MTIRRRAATLAVLLLAFSAMLPAYPVSARAPHDHNRLALRTLWTRSLSPNADSAPVYLSRVLLPSGRRQAMVYVLAGNNTSNCNSGDPVRRATLYAFETGGTLRWQRSTTGPSRCTTASPAVAGRWVYAPGMDGAVHRYDAGSGREDHKLGWPHRYTLMPDVEKSAASLTITQPYLYLTTSGFIGDQGHYQGHLLTIDLRSGRAHVFNSLCSNVHRLLGPTSGRPNYCSSEQSGLFGRGQGVTEPGTHDVYIVSGNGPWDGHANWGDSILKLDPGGSRLLDAFTPTNQSNLNAADADLGSTGPALLPDISRGGRVYHLLVQGGKGPACSSCSGVALRLLNRDNLSGAGGPGHLGGDLRDTQAPGGCEVLTAPAVWKSQSSNVPVFYANDCGTAAYRVSVSAAGTFHLDRVWSSASPGSTPILSGGVLYVAHSGKLLAYDPRTGHVLGATPIGSIHWEYPLVIGNRLYLTDENGHLTAFALR